MTKKRGTARIRGLAAELKDLRTKAGLNTREAAAQAGLSASTLNRIELGNRIIEVADMAGLLVVYGVTGVERERLLTMTREAGQPGWWETTGPGLPKEVPALINFEAEAARIVEVSLLRIPGLLQIPGYIREILTSAGVTGTSREAMVSARLGRQAVLTRPGSPQYVAIIDEAALQRPIGSPQVMAEQLRYVIAQASFANVDVRVVPFTLGAHTGLDGTYMTLEFTKARSIVYLEHKRSSLFVDEPEDVAPFHEATDILLETALDSSESVKFLTRLVADYEKS
ncbi:transcriptional regulator with XRE-family HTH domain [Kibdelosporangium banguiense]|uniref:Transcriptional regulator with XRE-family HTH domain n=1 Tax=Kibdelosporangium banguiense TaxID=1365924 RepID=A0ABS4TF33_9PSEU|nr:helix-turn-helix transcriptional regulator [Kibdelosporangium banguiense]MBP2323024.1 transcriptional regulator with XRE-family HTH domain [Kibdelosporangium banguiense]